MKPKIAVVDYGVGNLRSVYRALEHKGAKPVITVERGEIEKSDAMVMPGVGAFGDTIKEFGAFGDFLRDYVEKKPVLGICLGLQLFFSISEEDGLHKGFDLIKGRVVKLSDTLKIPHMGWNSLKIEKESRILDGIKDEDYFYFVHSYYAKPEEDVTVATTKYGVKIPALVEKGNVYATQFHPEKSGGKGLRIIENFVKIVNQTKEG
ncbi:MAG: imidazole glycerol phosphate synthase subunit HisH [Candidatus Hydrothermarchaeales archaeon]